MPDTNKDIMEALQHIMAHMATKEEVAENHAAVMKEIQALKMDQGIMRGIIEDNYATRRFEARLAILEDELEELKRKIG